MKVKPSIAAGRRARVGSRIVTKAVLLIVAAGVLGPLPVSATASCDVPIVMSDGTTLYANVTLPEGLDPVPTILTVTIYGKDVGTPSEGATCPTAPGLGASDTSLLANEGYAVVALDSRGTGRSAGVFNTFGDQDRQDYAEVLDWIQAQSWSDGQVGVTGCSALGIATLNVVTADQGRISNGKPRAVFAAWADSPYPDLYRDAYMGPGGMGGVAGSPATSALVGGPHFAGFRPGDPTSTPTHFLSYLLNNTSLWMVHDYQTDGDLMYYGSWFRERDVTRLASSVDIPIALNAGAHDYAMAQRAVVTYFDELVHSPKRVMFMSPGGHCEQSHFEDLGFGSSKQAVVRAWFDHWLKGTDNGIDSMSEVNYYPINGSRWVQSTVHPVEETEWTRLYLREGPSGSIQSINDGVLAVDPPTEPGRDLLPYVPAYSPEMACADEGPCVEPALTYTSGPLQDELVMAGFITGQIYASFDRQEGTMALTLWDVDASGAATEISRGLMRASLRAIDAGKTRYGPGGIVIRPHHYLTRGSKMSIEGNTDEYLIEFDPVSARIAAGHRIRLTISITDREFTQSGSLNSATAGETMAVARGSEAFGSNVLLPVIEGE